MGLVSGVGPVFPLVGPVLNCNNLGHCTVGSSSRGWQLTPPWRLRGTGQNSFVVQPPSYRLTCPCWVRGRRGNLDRLRHRGYMLDSGPCNCQWEGGWPSPNRHSTCRQDTALWHIAVPLQVHLSRSDSHPGRTIVGRYRTWSPRWTA